MAGKHVYTEKPVSHNLEGLDELAREVERDDLDVTPNHILVLKNAGLFSPSVTLESFGTRFHVSPTFTIAAAMFGFAVLAASEPGGVDRGQVRAHVEEAGRAAR